MKTTIEINDELFARSRKAAKREGKTLRALVEEGLRLALQARSQKTEPSFVMPVFGSGGLTDEFKNAGWSQIRDALYERHVEMPDEMPGQPKP
ncbi:type II toxin-antitoxin system VapB family antitoxin [Hydrocarboniphaga sp.]|uniref:type II toxin-antitoxin system VapB family antitoxin n=1 Tax=Hydrocarboniphaga sp. TaxID=2033016 RepID=UPI002608FB14|nr:type II toxin-antitoxin system VapB family antitoxin [Hydrocarboniphaga sp.]